MEGRKLSINVSDLTLALVITSNMIITCHSAAIHLYRRSVSHPEKLTLSEREQLISNIDPVEEEDHQNFQKLELIRTSRKDPLPKWNIEAIQTKLSIAVDKYKSCNKQIKELYRDIKGCGISGCPNFNNFIPKIKHDPDADYFKKRKRHFRKKVHQLLERFREGLEKIHKSFDDMLKFENSTKLNNKMRMHLLNKLVEQIGVLKFEVEEKLNPGKGEISLTKTREKQLVFPYPSNQTDLLIQEWYVIKASERYLIEWQKILIDLVKQTEYMYNLKRKDRKHMIKKVPIRRRKERVHKRKGLKS